jgi:hypothetical protein
MDDLTLKIDTGAPVEVPAFEPDECGHNWLAVVENRDPRAPGGLRRRFQPRAGVPFYYLVEGLKVGDVIEFGADHVSLKPSRQHRKQPKRVYGVIREINAELLRYRFLFPVWKEYLTVPPPLTPFPCPRASAPAYAAAIFTLALIESSQLQPLPGDDKQDIQIAIFVPY